MTKTLILDLDETLFHTMRYTQLADYTPVIDEEGNTGHFSCPRPGVYEFLHEIQTKGWDIIALTLGVVPFQEEVLKTLGMRDFMGGVYGWTSIDRRAVSYPPQNLERFVLVDNCPIDDGFRVGQKVGWLNKVLSVDTNYVHVEDFFGNPEVKPLLDYLPRIEELMNA